MKNSKNLEGAFADGLQVFFGDMCSKLRRGNAFTILYQDSWMPAYPLEGFNAELYTAVLGYKIVGRVFPGIIKVVVYIHLALSIPPRYQCRYASQHAVLFRTPSIAHLQSYNMPNVVSASPSKIYWRYWFSTLRDQGGICPSLRNWLAKRR